MDNFSIKKNDYLVEISKFMLIHGISSCSLKKMAEAASTSDRMLMHYFKDKDEIVLLALKRISQDMFQLLDHGPKHEFAFEEFVPFLIQSIKNTQYKPYFDIWFELVHLASNGKEPYRAISEEIGKTYWHWILSSSKPAANEDKERMASLLFAFIEGCVLLCKMGMHDKVDVATDVLLKFYQTSKQ